MDGILKTVKGVKQRRQSQCLGELVIGTADDCLAHNNKDKTDKMLRDEAGNFIDNIREFGKVL